MTEVKRTEAPETLADFQRIARHADLATTRRYVGQTLGTMGEAARKMNEAMG